MDKLYEMLAQMEKFGFPVIDDLSKFFSFMVGNEDGVTMALEVFEELKVNGYYSLGIYNILMEALQKSREIKKALSLFNEMKDVDLQSDSCTYSIGIMSFVEDGDIHEACACYNKIIEMSCVPSIAAYCSLARGLCKIGEIDAVMLLVDDRLASVTSGPIGFKYSLTILHACKSNNAEKVVEVLNKMLQQGCLPDDVVYSAIISLACVNHTIEEARKIFSNLKERNILSEANMIVYNEVLIEHMKKKTAHLVVSGLKAKGSKLLSG